MSADPYDDILKRAQELSTEQQQRLVDELAQEAGRKNDSQKHSIMELKGLGKEIWQGMDADEYVAKERDSWSGYNARNQGDTQCPQTLVTSTTF